MKRVLKPSLGVYRSTSIHYLRSYRREAEKSTTRISYLTSYVIVLTSGGYWPRFLEYAVNLQYSCSVMSLRINLVPPKLLHCCNNFFCLAAARQWELDFPVYHNVRDWHNELIRMWRMRVLLLEKTSTVCVRDEEEFMTKFGDSTVNFMFGLWFSVTLQRTKYV